MRIHRYERLRLWILISLYVLALHEAYTYQPPPPHRRVATGAARSMDGHLTRKDAILSSSAVATTFFAALYVPSLALAEYAGTVVPQGQASRDGALIYTSPASGFSFAYPETMKLAPKLLKTHLEEVTLKSEVRKGFSVGVAVDPVRIARIEDIGAPDEVGKRIVALEQKKEGVIVVQLLDTRQAKGPPADMTYYYFDYTVESTRGEKRYLAKAAVRDQRLYVLTVEVKKIEYDAAKPEVDGILESFRLA